MEALVRCVIRMALYALVCLSFPTVSFGADLLRCGPFAATSKIAEPQSREAAPALRRFEEINQEANAHSYHIIFLGDSLTERWHEVPQDRTIWNHYFEPMNALNAGVNGDRTEHLLWRIKNGNISHQRPKILVLLIGTNDLGHHRTADVAAEGIRQILLALREMLPSTRIMLEGLWPRSDRDAYTPEITWVNQSIQRCVDNTYIFFRNPGQHLLNREGRLPRDLAPDGLHPNPRGYALISQVIAKELNSLLAGR